MPRTSSTPSRSWSRPCTYFLLPFAPPSWTDQPIFMLLRSDIQAEGPDEASRAIRKKIKSAIPPSPQSLARLLLPSYSFISILTLVPPSPTSHPPGTVRPTASCERSPSSNRSRRTLEPSPSPSSLRPCSLTDSRKLPGTRIPTRE
jgi:hypothetical protein